MQLSEKLGPNGRPILGLFKKTAAAAPQPPAPKSDLAPVRRWLRETYPAIRDCQPLAVGVSAEIKPMAKSAGFSCKALKIVMREHTSSAAYLAALAAPDSHRHDLQGAPVSPVTDAHRAHAANLGAIKNAD